VTMYNCWEKAETEGVESPKANLRSSGQFVGKGIGGRYILDGRVSQDLTGLKRCVK
jgi:hypothetical protein